VTRWIECDIELGAEDIRAILDDLSDELASHGARADLFLVGGATIAVAYDQSRSTRDLDAVFLPTDVVREAARAVAERRGLAMDWLNDAVKGVSARARPRCATLLRECFPHR
jgi:hypothetical protein